MPTEVDTADERAPFDATVDGVTALVPEVRLWNSDQPIPNGTYAVTAEQVQAWVDELSGVVAMTLEGWQRISDEPVAPETTSDREQLIEYARTVVHNGAASYLEAARRPEQAQRSSTSYADVLWNRYTTGLDRLAAWLTRRLAQLEPGDTVEESTGGASWSFPCPIFLDGFPV